MEKEILKVLVNKYMIQLKTDGGKDFLYTNQKVDPETMSLLKEYKSQLIDYIKQEEKVNVAKNHVAFLTSFLDALERARAKASENVLETFMEGGSKECNEILESIENHKKLYPEDSARAVVYKYIFDKAYRATKRYNDLYFATIGDKYIDDVVVAPVETLESIKDVFNAEVEAYHAFKHNDRPDT